MKYLLIVILIILITYVGRGLSRYYIDRQRFFTSFIEFLQYLLSNISFEKDKLPAVVRKFKNRSKNKYIVDVLSQYERSLVKNEDLQLDIKILKDEEKDKITNILHRLGKTDYATEVANLETAVVQVKAYSDNATLERDKYGGFYTKMALLLGLALAILLI